MDLQIKASQMRLDYTSTTDFNRRTEDNRGIVPKGFCYKFHNSRFRCYNNSCSFKHQCPRCAATHPAYQECINGNAHMRTPSHPPTNMSNTSLQPSTSTGDINFRNKTSNNTNLPNRTVQTIGGLRQ